MAFKCFFICSSVLLVQLAQALYVPPSPTVAGNSVVNNDIYISNPSQLSSLGFGSNLAGLAGVSSGLAGVNSGLAGVNSGLASVSSGLASGLSSGLAAGGFGSGLAAGSLGLAGSSLGTGLGSSFGITGLGADIVASSPLTVTSISPIGPSGLAVASENVLEGILTVNGQLPFLSAVAFEGPLPTSGSGVATCGCGSGNVGIVSEGFPQGQALPNAGLGLGRGLVL